MLKLTRFTAVGEPPQHDTYVLLLRSAHHELGLC